MFVSVSDSDKPRIVEAVKLLAELGFKIIATGGTQRFLTAQGIAATRSTRCWKAGPHIVDAIKNGEVQLVFNTTEGAQALSDSRSLRRAALLHKVPYYTTLAGAVAAAQGIKAYKGGRSGSAALQSYFGLKPGLTVGCRGEGPSQTVRPTAGPGGAGCVWSFASWRRRDDRQDSDDRPGLQLSRPN